MTQVRILRPVFLARSTAIYKTEAKGSAKPKKSKEIRQHPNGFWTPYHFQAGARRTDRALCRLTSEVRGDPVHSTRYGRQRHCRFEKFSLTHLKVSQLSTKRGETVIFFTSSSFLPPFPFSRGLPSPGPSPKRRGWKPSLTFKTEDPLLKTGFKLNLKVTGNLQG